MRTKQAQRQRNIRGISNNHVKNIVEWQLPVQVMLYNNRNSITLNTQLIFHEKPSCACFCKQTGVVNFFTIAIDIWYYNI